MCPVPTTRSLLPKNKWRVGISINLSFSFTCDLKLETFVFMCDLHIDQTKIYLRKFEAILYGSPSKSILIHFLVEPAPPCLQRFSNTKFIVW